MYLNIGNKLILEENIIGIFDFDNTTTSKNTQNFLRACEKSKTITFLSLDLPKSFIIYRENNINHVFVCDLTPKTLQKRMEAPDVHAM